MTETEQLIEDLEQIFSVFRHIFGNTVNSLKITLDVLIRNYHTFDDSTTQEFLYRALEQVDRQHEFLNAMRTYARSDVGKIEETPLIVLWNDLLVSARSRLNERKIRLSHDIQAVPRSVLINLTSVRKIMEHLVDNAIDAVNNTEFPEIQLSAFTHSGSLVIQVSDNGEGIPPEIRSKVFTPFFTTREGHFGLGLSISRKTLSQMDGRLELSNRLPAGTEARIWLKTA